MLTPEQIAEYRTERKAIAALKAGFLPKDLDSITGEELTPLLALAAACDALGLTVEECPVMAAYKEALRPFGELHIGSNWPDTACIAEDQDGEQITAGDIRKARALVKE